MDFEKKRDLAIEIAEKAFAYMSDNYEMDAEILFNIGTLLSAAACDIVGHNRTDYVQTLSESFLDAPRVTHAPPEEAKTSH